MAVAAKLRVSCWPEALVLEPYPGWAQGKMTCSNNKSSAP